MAASDNENLAQTIVDGMCIYYNFIRSTYAAKQENSSRKMSTHITVLERNRQ